MTIFLCDSGEDGTIPDVQIRRTVDRFLATAAREHIAIFVDSQKPRQVWQWVKRTSGQTPAYRETWFHPGANGEALVQKVLAIEFQFEEEEGLSLTRVEERVRKAFDLDKVTKRFYDRFRDERKAFLRFVKGIQTEGDQAWYASLMINRLMFVYFIQKKHFLDGDPDYLRNRLETCRKSRGKDKFHSFYRHFLLRLFHEGLGRVERSHELDELLGKIPYLNGGLFEVHTLEERNPNIQIADEAFERLFAFFDTYQWHLDDRPLKSDNEINPDVLGFIFEKYINQKELGAYYTGKDITDYISGSTLIPFLIKRLESQIPEAFSGKGGLWDSLSSHPDRYFFSEAKHGAGEPYSLQIARGLANPSMRDGWNSPAPPITALPGETWRDVVHRRQHYEAFLKEASSHLVNSAEAVVRWNLDLRHIILDLIEESDDPRIVAMTLRLVKTMSILDPTCGSGAFLFSALNIIQDLYEGCLDRMEAFLAEREAGQRSIDTKTLSFFQAELARVAEHPNRRYYVLKSSIVSNLFGVDIMEEAAEICKLRLFLKIVAQVDRVEDLEALPDIDFNIRVGNTLVGFTRLDEVSRAITTVRKGQRKLVSDDKKDTLKRIEDQARKADLSFRVFRDVQTARGSTVEEIKNAKQLLKQTLSSLEQTMNIYIASEYGVDTTNKGAFSQWIGQYHPFHWLVDFYGTMKAGGFDIIIGNPPYLEVNQVGYRPQGLETLESGAIHAMCIERSSSLLQTEGAMSMIVPLSLVSTQRMTAVQRILERKSSVFYANFAWRPGKLFDGVNRALTIFVAITTADHSAYSTCYRKWASEHRDSLMHLVAYEKVPRERPFFWVPKLGTEIEQPLLRKMLMIKPTLGRFKGKGKIGVFYRTTGGLYWKVFTNFAPAFKINGKAGHSSRETTFAFRNTSLVVPAIALLSSDLFWWWYTITSNLRDLNPSDIEWFPVPDGVLDDKKLETLGKEYLKDLVDHSDMLTRVQKQTGTTQTQSFKIQQSKQIIDKIDQRLAKLYGLSDEELDFIRNYDIKFRMSDSDQEGEA
jgi:hypothetical protein